MRPAVPALLPLTIVVAFLLATGRWGSYLGIPSWNVFVTDVGLVISAGWLLLRSRHLLSAARLRPLIPVLAFGSWAVLRFLVGGQYDMVALRDLAPYAYVFVALSACVVTAAHGATLVLLAAALVSHLVWVWIALLSPDWAAELPLLGGKVRVLEFRADFDGTVLAVLALLAALTAARRESRTVVRLSAGALALASAYPILELGSRAGLLALGVGAALVGVTHSAAIRLLGRARLLAAAGVVIAVVAIVLPQTYVFDRLVADPAQRTDAAAGTLAARWDAWRLVLEDSSEDPVRLVLGSGFGPDFLDRSGAAFSFEGYVEKGVRAPHNFILNTLGRVGLVGVGLLGWVAYALARSLLRLRSPSAREGDRGRLATLALLLVGALGVASLVGVILESPFGAVPFWWAVGLLLVGAGRETVHEEEAAHRSVTSPG